MRWNPASLKGSWFRVTLLYWGHTMHTGHLAPSDRLLLLRSAWESQGNWHDPLVSILAFMPWSLLLHVPHPGILEPDSCRSTWWPQVRVHGACALLGGASVLCDTTCLLEKRTRNPSGVLQNMKHPLPPPRKAVWGTWPSPLCCSCGFFKRRSGSSCVLRHKEHVC